MSRFSQAISEGDGISVVPLLTGDVGELARAAEGSGAEAVAVDSPDLVERVRAVAGLPILLRRPLTSRAALDAAGAAGVDAVVLRFDELADEGDLLEELHGAALDLGVTCAIDVRDEDELGLALERIDPDLVAVSCRDAEDGDELERTLDVLPDVPVGKLVISETRALVREQALALERAGVDAVLVADVAAEQDFSRALEELVGGGEAG